MRGQQSDLVTVTSGVPQGSHIGPLLFSIFINDISSCLNDCKFLLYADDLKIYRTVTSLNDALKIQTALDHLVKYCKLNYLILNVNKCNQITFSRCREPLIFTYTIDNVALNKCNSVRDLGVIFDTKLTFDAHVEMITKKALQLLGFVTRVTSDFRSPDTVKLLFCTLVRSQLEYASVIWNPHYATHSKRIERVQKKFIYTLNYRYNKHLHYATYTLCLRFYKITSLVNRRVVTDMCVLFKLVNSLIEISSLDSLAFYINPRRTRNRQTFILPTVNTVACQNSPMYRLQSTYNNCFVRIDIFHLNLHNFKQSILRQLNC